jgi:hypothetical protein
VLPRRLGTCPKVGPRCSHCQQQQQRPRTHCSNRCGSNSSGSTALGSVVQAAERESTQNNFTGRMQSRHRQS